VVKKFSLGKSTVPTMWLLCSKNSSGTFRTLSFAGICTNPSSAHKVPWLIIILNNSHLSIPNSFSPEIRNRKQQLEAVQHLVQLLPAANRDTLASLLKFFAKVVANAGETRSVSGEMLPGNKMEGYSLATLIAPNILPCMEGGTTSTDHTLTKERRESIDVVNYMISNHQQLFDVTPELLHDVYLHLLDTQPEGVEGLLKIKSGFAEE
jgi:hypothetical protein